MFNFKKMLLVSTAATTVISGPILSTAYADESNVTLVSQSSTISVGAYTLTDYEMYYLASAAFCNAQGLSVPSDIAAAVEQIYKNHPTEANAYLSSLGMTSGSTQSSDTDTATVEASTAGAATNSAEGANNTSTAQDAATAEALAVSTEVTAQYVEQSDGTSLFYTVDPLTGAAVEIYNGWYTNANGDKMYFEDGSMVSGWIIDDGKFYYLDPSTGVMVTSQFAGNFYLGEDGAALMDTTNPDGVKLAYNGSVIKSGSPVEALNDKTYTYRNFLVKNPDLYAEFSERSSGGYQIMPEKENGFAWYTYATMKLYKRKANGSMGDKIYEGDGCFRTDAVIEVKESDGTISTISPSDLIGSGHEVWVADHIHIDPAGYITYTAAQK